MPASVNTRTNVYVLIDEAHRTTGGDLGNYLMAGLPNATFIGFTGTPVDKTIYGKGTFKTFGGEDDKGYLHKYSISESIDDGNLRRSTSVSDGIRPRRRRCCRYRATHSRRTGLVLLVRPRWFAVVAVHPDFGLVRVRRLAGAFAAGRILNEKTAAESDARRRNHGHRAGAHRGDHNRSETAPDPQPRPQRVPRPRTRGRSADRRRLHRRA